MAEIQFPGWRLHKRRGEALPYYNGIAAASLAQQYQGSTPALNIAAVLPAGTFVLINTIAYITRRALQSGEWGEIDPLNWHPTYIMPKKVGDTFADRAAVYWDATNCYATSTSAGNTLIGYALINGDLCSGSTTSGSTLASAGSLTSFDGQTKAYSVTGGTSADGQVKNYGASDISIEVEVVLTSTATVNQTGQSTNIVADPGTAANVVVTAGGTCELTIAAAGETRGLPAPTFDGQRMMLNIKGFTASATAKVALGAAYNATPGTTVDGTNKFVTFNAFGQGCLLEAIPLTASTYKWMLIANLGGTLSAS